MTEELAARESVAPPPEATLIPPSSQLRSPFEGDPLTRKEAKALADVLAALAAPARLRLVSLMVSAPDGAATVYELTEGVGLRQPTISFHLKKLREAGLVSVEPQGVVRLCEVVDPAFSALADLLRPPKSMPRRAGNH